ncbi:chalcone isomerase family protein [Kiritimatiellota bacterium B12222]|nr:chalcone isomerase family protein [Kiritimatiellota bacterium B12222]
MKYIFFSTLLFITAFPSGAESIEVADHSYPLTFEAQSLTWQLQGSDHFKYKGIFSVFTAAYHESDEGNGQKLSFTYTRKLKADDLRDQAMKTLRKQNDPQTLEKFTEPLEEIQAAFIDVQPDDRYAITVIQEQGTWLHLNDKEIFYTPQADFGIWYLKIWIGEAPISISLKTALLP